MQGQEATITLDPLPRARVAILSTRWNPGIIEPLVAGALEVLHAHQIDDQRIDHIRVPGAFELPLAADRAAATARYDGLVVLGAVIRGDTPHFDFVAGECAAGLREVSVRRGIPLGFGVLTTDNLAQAQARSDLAGDNKGRESALAMLEMIHLLNGIGS